VFPELEPEPELEVVLECVPAVVPVELPVPVPVPVLEALVPPVLFDPDVLLDPDVVPAHAERASIKAAAPHACRALRISLEELVMLSCFD
jgi:hypothetical protein